MGIYGHKFDNLIENSKPEVFTEGLIWDTIKNCFKEYKEYKEDRKKKLKKFKELRSQNPSKPEAEIWKDVYKSFQIDNKQKVAEEKVEMFKGLSSEEKENWKNAIEAFKKSFDKYKTKIKEGTKTAEGNKFVIHSDSFSVSPKHVYKDSLEVGEIYIDYKTEYDTNVELFNLFDSIAGAVEKDLKKYGVHMTDFEEGRCWFFNIDRH